MDILSPNTAIGDCLETAFHLKTYQSIMDCVQSSDFSADKDFRIMYNGFYRIRQKKSEWYEAYYALMVEQKSTPRSFKELLLEMSNFGSIEVSFVSKLIATINPEKPLWDQYVIRNIGMEKEWNAARNRDFCTRIDLAVSIYASIEKWYQDFLDTSNGKACILKFDEILPKYSESLTNIKKIDYLLWGKR